ncbi:MAG: hypothetical protein HZA24_12265 [Nitrospirae bacterium]|nr:hypothetical protein [Nitrospirota bacterium]
MNIFANPTHPYRPFPALLASAALLFTTLAATPPARAATLDLKVLVIAVGNAEPRTVMTELLDAVGVPYDVLDAATTPLTAATLASGTHGRYNGIILTEASLVSTGGSAFSLAEWQTLHAYERDFGVREAVMSGDPVTNAGLDLDYGMGALQYGGNVSATWQAPAGGTDLFEYVNTATPLTITDWAVSGQPAGGAGRPVAQPLLVRAATPGQVLVSTLTYANGREVLLCSIANASYLPYSRLLAYEFLNFATKGVFVGARQVFLAAHSDDLFVTSPSWNAANNTTDTNTIVRMTPADVTNAVARQNAIVAAHPTLSDFAIEFAFNGGGAADHLDPLVQAMMKHKRHFRFINHTLTHMDMDLSNGTTYAMAHGDMDANILVWDRLQLPEMGPNRPVLVSGGHSGLEDVNDAGVLLASYPAGKNDAFLQASQDLGIRFLASDTSRANQASEEYVPGFNLMLLPRWPTGVFYNTSTPSLNTDEYNVLFGTNYTYAQILDVEAEATLGHMLTYRMWPHYFHQSNLHAYDGNGATLQFDWLEAVLARYEQFMKLPVLNLPYHEIARRTRNRVDALAATVTASLDTATNQVTVAASQPARVMLTGVAGGVPYGGQRIMDVGVGTAPRTFAVDRMLAQ